MRKLIRNWRLPILYGRYIGATIGATIEVRDGDHYGRISIDYMSGRRIADWNAVIEWDEECVRVSAKGHRWTCTDTGKTERVFSQLS